MHTFLNSKEAVKNFFQLAGFTPHEIIEVPNRYWPRCEDYLKLRDSMPWWLVETEYGRITIGPRKRVISIEWKDTKHPVIVTTDDTTKEDYLVHAWETVKCLEYLINLRKSLACSNINHFPTRAALEAQGITNITDCKACGGKGYEYTP
jgi:hypothetical protein